MTFDIINSIGRLLLTVIVVYKVTQFREMANPLERLGLGMMGGGSFLTIAVIWDAEGPFSGWAVSILTYGAVLFLVGRTYRDTRHQRQNEKQLRIAREHFAARSARDVQ